MDGLSFLFGILTLLFLVAILGMNLANASRQEEHFVDSGSVAKSEIASQIRETLDKLAFYTSQSLPDGSPSDGAKLCTIMSLIRMSMAENEGVGQNLSDAEISKRVEATLSTAIPGGVLPCPLLQYPSDSATDLEWLTWLQTVPTDFGARVVLMAAYADVTLSSIAKKMKDALSGNINIPSLQGFVDVCTPTLSEKKRSELEEKNCSLPESLTPAQIKEAVTKLLKKLVSEKERILAKVTKENPLTLGPIDVRTHIQNAIVAANYLNKQKQSLEAGTLTLSGSA
jgi:hypothetical protein